MTEEKKTKNSIPEMLTLISSVREEIRKGFIGNDTIIDRLLTGFFSGLHILIEDIPGVGKTTLARCLAKAAGLDFGRIQFTPDLLPGDILGISVWSREKQEFIFKKGGIMHQFLLADEINRASARTQSSLLEAMQESKITVDGITYPLPDPFFVIATQNPVSFSGTFMLPEAELDRFGISFSLGYPLRNDEKIIIEKKFDDDVTACISAKTDADGVKQIKAAIRAIHLDEKIKDYILRIAEATRKDPKVKLGLSPRGAQHLCRASQTFAFMKGRDFVIPEDVKDAAALVIPHKLALSAQARMENLDMHTIVNQIVLKIAQPTGL